MTGLTADWESQHIEGYARAAYEAGKPAGFSCPLISHIQDNLYVGGCRDGVRLGWDFKHVVSLYKWERYTLGPDTQLHEYEMYDSADVPDAAVLESIADDVNRYLAEGKTLVHCQAGLNRSNLITALSLIRAGMQAQGAINLLRAKRSPVVLCNTSFEAWLLQQVAP